MNKIQFQNIIIITFIYRHVCTLHSFLSANHRSITNIPFIPPDSKEIRHFQLVYHVCASSITQRFIFQYFTTIFFINLRHILFILSRSNTTNILIKIIRTINVHQSGMLYQFGIQSGIRTLKPNQLPVLFLSKQVTFRPENLRQINSYLKFTTRHQKQFKPLPSYPQCRFTGQHHICFVAKTSILGHRNGLTENIKE